MIDSFTGEHAFLSNFYHSSFKFFGNELPTVEHGFQALKCVDPLEAEFVLSSPIARQAKDRGRNAELRPDWDSVKDMVMYQLVAAKFGPNRELAEKLIGTGAAHLVEGNAWGDTYWGVYAGHGKNRLGYILMDVRSRLQKVARYLD